jgi:CysZ protein
MFAAAAKAFSQMLSPPFWSLLMRSVGLAVLILIVLIVALKRVFLWLAEAGRMWLEPVLGAGAHEPLMVVVWILSFAAGLAFVAGAVFLMPTVTALTGGFFGDEIAREVERAYYPTDPPGLDVSVPLAVWEGVKFAALTILVYLCALPFLLFAGLGFLIFFFATAYLLGRQYFELAAMRFHPVADAKAMRKAHAMEVFMAGMLIAAFVSIPIVNLATPLFGTALMVHLHKRMMGAVGRISAA